MRAGTKKIEIIIVENGSTDDTYLLAEDMASLYSNITAVRSQKGVSAARNKGIDIAKGEWIFFLDADDFILKGSITKLLHDADRLVELDVVWSCKWYKKDTACRNRKNI